MKISVLGAAGPAKGIIFLGCYSTQRSLNLIIPMRWLLEPLWISQDVLRLVAVIVGERHSPASLDINLIKEIR